MRTNVSAPSATSAQPHSADGEFSGESIRTLHDVRQGLEKLKACVVTVQPQMIGSGDAKTNPQLRRESRAKAGDLFLQLAPALHRALEENAAQSNAAPVQADIKELQNQLTHVWHAFEEACGKPDIECHQWQ